jgi:predicted nucleotidyltransferase
VCVLTSFGLLNGCPIVLNTVSAKQASRMKQSLPSTSFSLRREERMRGGEKMGWERLRDKRDEGER